MKLSGSSRRKRIADVLAVGAPIAVGLSIAMIPIRLLVEGDTHVTCGSVRDLIVRFVTGAMPVLDLGGIALGIAALVLGARVKGYAILGILLGVVTLPALAAFALTACY
jgi:hypothetical protein